MQRSKGGVTKILTMMARSVESAPVLADEEKRYGSTSEI
jgi:hypothetical protein